MKYTIKITDKNLVSVTYYIDAASEYDARGMAYAQWINEFEPKIEVIGVE